ncbi:hypothetical protein QJ528_10775 [Staphylococcus warneri]|uniref:hypothetical protein n=1 Tax=Staphylococcus warneri TaxID=1292 RepID=UPI00254159D0|nr:hypothetical protein [Staphylococcus warneri]MDK4214546.1 hypothetical protein [Staphylococcus warneri]
MNFEKAKEQTKYNDEKMLINGYHSLIDHLDEKIQNVIDDGKFFIRINKLGLIFFLVNEDNKVDSNTIKAVIHHYKKQGANAYLEIKEGYRTEAVISFRQEHLVIDWSDN